MNRFGRKSIVSMVVVLALTGCGNMVKMNIKSEKDLNSVSSTLSTPVVVRVYQLSDDVAFKSAGFRDLWKRDAEILGPALLSSKEIVMQPDTQEKIALPLNENTKFVAGFAIFRNPDASKWSFIEPVSNGFFAGYWHKLFSVGISLRLGQGKIENLN
jgi:type VI secretion system protein VasD